MRIITPIFLLLIILISNILFAGAVETLTPRHKQNLNIGWQYHRGDATGQPFNSNYDDGAWESVNLPHTYQLTSINLDDCADDKSQPTFHRDISWYRRAITINIQSGQKAFLEFEGAHQITDLWVNGNYIGQHAVSAYTPFHFDVTDYVHNGDDNLVVLKLDNRKTDQVPPDGHVWDYVLFGGLYRDVYLIVTDAVHITFPWESYNAGIHITTPSVTKKNATVSVRTTVRNDGETSRNCQITTRIVDADNILVFKMTKQAVIQAGREHTFIQTGGMDKNIKLWSFESPYLYRVNSQIIDLEQNKVIDAMDNPLGLRWFDLHPGIGFCLNGDPVELVGANRHQQYPYIGDAVPDNLHRNDAIKMKRAGMNCIRLAHYPHDDAFLKSCDSLGILITEEPPTWLEMGPAIWMDRLEESLRRTIRNHRNHPCVFAWGAGINHRGPIKRLHYAAKEEDPNRLSMNNGTLSVGPLHSGITDLYAVMDYRGATVPEDEFLFAMEHSGTPDTRGIQEIVSKYKADPARIGLTVWSAHDNYSFYKRNKVLPNLAIWSASPWDIFRIPKPPYFWYKSELTSEPMVHIADDRAQTDSTVIIFSNCEHVELFVDSKSLGIREPERDSLRAHLDSPAFEFPYSWKTGKLTAHGLQDGKIMATHSIAKAGKAHHIELRIDHDCAPVYADGGSIFMAYARICDKQGTTVIKDSTAIHFQIKGPGEIIGDAAIGANPLVWERGIAPVLVRASTTPGEITLTAKGKGLKSASANISTMPWTDIVSSAKPIYEPLQLAVDLGATRQHIEDEWQAWVSDGKTTASATFTTNNHHSISATVSSPDDSLTWTRLVWGVPGDYSAVIKDGVTTNANSSIQLTLSGIPKGHYQLKTWHHVSKDNWEMAPAFQIYKVDTLGKQLVKENFQPSYGQQSKISKASGSKRGDGGSILGAARFALVSFKSDGTSSFSLIFQGNAEQGTIGLNGFELIEIISK